MRQRMAGVIIFVVASRNFVSRFPRARRRRYSRGVFLFSLSFFFFRLFLSFFPPLPSAPSIFWKRGNGITKRAHHSRSVFVRVATCAIYFVFIKLPRYLLDQWLMFGCLHYICETRLATLFMKIATALSAGIDNAVSGVH